MITELITQRDAVAEDLPFLARLYGDSRRHEVSAWGWPPEQQEWFLRMQFDAQRSSYLAHFPYALDRIVLREYTPIGRILTCKEDAAMRLIGIALIEEQRQQGIGTYLLRELLKECEELGWAMHLQVAQGNPAMRLYQRLGFLQMGGDPVYLQMEWKPLPGKGVVAS
jgi:ribosomal protein S18 acetylase RimI-like enzyme